jgi:hypothetical protein
MTASPFFFRQAAAALALALCSSLAAADTSFNISIDTSGFGSSGWLDMQFNPNGGLYTPAATATVTNFAGFDAAAAAYSEGSVAGSLQSGYVFGNDSYYNDLFHAVNYGGVLSFTVTFAGDAELTGNLGQSLFTVAAYAADEVTPLGVSSGDSLLAITWTPATVAGMAGSASAVTYSAAAAVSAVPEPSSWLMLGIGAMLVAGAARRRT